MLLEANFRASRSKQCPADCSSVICLFTSFGHFEFEWFFPFVPLRDLFVTRGHLLQMTYLLQSCKYFFLVIISLSTFSVVSLTIQVVFMQPICKSPLGVSGFCVTRRRSSPTAKYLKKYYLAFSSATLISFFFLATAWQVGS